MKRLKHKYRFVILHDKSFEEKASFSLKGYNVLAFFSIVFVLLFAGVFSLIAFTSLRLYIPGYADIETKRKVNELVYRADSLEYQMAVKDQYLSNLRHILQGDEKDHRMKYDRSGTKKVVKKEKTKQQHKQQKKKSKAKIKAKPETTVPADTHVEKPRGYSTPYQMTLDLEKQSRKESIDDYAFYSPLKGVVTEGFNPAKGHYAVDVVAKPNVGIKAVLDGVVVFADWTVNTGNVLILSHENKLISVYKHNSVLLKKVGNFVKAGDVVSIIGESGELSHGPHLHFELWYDGNPIDPEKYITF